jgi:subtilase family serine protease
MALAVWESSVNVAPFGGCQVTTEWCIVICIMHSEGFAMHRRLFALVAAGVLASPLAAAVPLAAEAAPSQTGLTARNVAVCPTPQNTLTARCHAIRHELVDRNGKPVSPNSLTAHGKFPADLQDAYSLVSASLNYGAGQTIAIVDAYDDPTAAADLATYRSAMGLPSIATSNCSLTSPSRCFVKVNQNGVAGPFPQANGGWAQEISLDLDMASAICPNCNILLVEASSASFTNLGASVNTAARLGAVAISNSYGSSGDASDASYGTYYNHKGIAVTASTGDSGYGVGYPATSNYTVAVGGTTLTNDGTNTVPSWSESAWSGAGSGCSTYQTRPTWQPAVGNNACNGMRAIADVSADADPNTGVAVYDSYSYGGASGWLQFGGTSVSSPIIASVYALAKGTGANWSGNPASVLYTHSTALNDATGGSNSSTCTSVLCTGGTGWDGPTGLGTPNGLAAFGGGTTTTPPSAPTGLGYSVNGGTVTLNWTTASDAASYNVYRDTVKIGSPTTVSYSDTVPNGTYFYYVTAVNSSGQESVPSNTVSVTVSNSTFTAPSITGKSCSGGATCTFTATGSDPLTWNFGKTGSTATTTYTSPGGYTVTVTNNYGKDTTSVSCVWNGRGHNKSLSCSIV